MGFAVAFQPLYSPARATDPAVASTKVKRTPPSTFATAARVGGAPRPARTAAVSKTRNRWWVFMSELPLENELEQVGLVAAAFEIEVVDGSAVVADPARAVFEEHLDVARRPVLKLAEDSFPQDGRIAAEG